MSCGESGSEKTGRQKEEVHLSGLILAGGRSSRMGQDKATIEIAGKPLIRRIYDVVAACDDSSTLPIGNIYVVTPWVNRYQHLLPISCHFILEQQPHQGPLLGFAAGLTQINSTWILLVACDLPNLSTPVIQNWIAGLKDVPPQSIAYLPKNPRKGWEPLCGFYRRSCLDSLLEYISASETSFQGWLAKNSVSELPIGDRQCLLNCNSPADLLGITTDRSVDRPDS